MAMNAIEQLEIAAGHRQVGWAIGRRFGDRIHHVFDNYAFLQERLLPFHRSATGRSLYRAFLELHSTRFPDYLAELEGMAQGVERPFEELFLVNLRGEYGGLMALERPAANGTVSGEQGCTDCLVLRPEAALIGHNEDGTPSARGRMFVVRASIAAEPPFTALCYPGFLPGNAFGFNAAGVMHTVDAVSPRQVRVGLGRHFLARSLLDASSLADAIERVTVPRRAAGFTYNIGFSPKRKLVCVEVSPDRHHVHEVQGYHLHTNHYLNLSDVGQEIGPSSRARLVRARATCRDQPPTQAMHILSLLGDETDCEHPIYRTAVPPDGSATLCTALFDLDSRQLRIYTGHPIRQPEQPTTLDL
jgi:hypothetical protein